MAVGLLKECGWFGILTLAHISSAMLLFLSGEH